VDSVEPCSEHTEDGVGLCQAGERTCVTGTDKSSSAFGACVGAVGPSPRRCNSSADNNCDGAADNTVDTTCACVIGAARLCQEHPGLDGFGRCKAGQQTCLAAADNSTSAYGACSGAVGPLAADSCTVAGDDSNCDGVANGACACVAGQGNGPCSGNPSASRCDATGACVACAANADCSLVSGLPVCNAGVCEAVSTPPDVDAGG
jgi:hypothetical protein